MDNLSFISHASKKLKFGTIGTISYEPATKTLVVVSESRIHFIKHHSNTNDFEETFATGCIEELQESQVVLLCYLVESDAVLCGTKMGDVFTVDINGDVDYKAKNDDGLSAGSVSPTQEYVYLVTMNNTLIQLDMEFNLVKEIPIDDSETEVSDSFRSTFSWKVDGSFFALNIQTDKGRKVHTRDHMMGIFRSASKSDPNEDGPVQSVSEKSRPNMNHLVAWQPSGGLIAGSDFIDKGGKKINRVIFWEKNGLRHLEFQLQEQVTDVLQLNWSADSKILVVEGLLINSQRVLMFYHRANYHWYLKQVLKLSSTAHYCLIKHKCNSLIIVDHHGVEQFEFDIELSTNQWKNEQMQMQNPLCPHYVVDGPLLKITDFNKGIVPPPMCTIEQNFNGNIMGSAIKHNNILVITESLAQLYNYQDDSRTKLEMGDLSGKNIVNLRLHSLNPLLFESDGQGYTETDGKITSSPLKMVPEQSYKIDASTEKVFKTSLKNQCLYLNDELIHEHCTSYGFYHQFLLFTCASTGMYDKLYTLNLHLNTWLHESDSRKSETIASIMEELETQKSLSFRWVERGAQIVCCSTNRVIFQLPRGNLETILPKAITINLARQQFNRGNFKDAFETIRTHKLDLNLLYDIDPAMFEENAEAILTGIGKVDYINLFVTQMKDSLSDELQYCLPSQRIEEIENYHKIKIEGQKVKLVCGIVSKTLRALDKEKFILSIFTSDIKMGLLNQVLREIKELKEFDQQVLVPPHLEAKKSKSKKKMTSQDILEYVCWLVDANAIYEASLLTYDLEMASMAARCTQMDPKQYIPYLEALKQTESQIQLRKKICLDLKRYDQAIIELAQGGEEEIDFAVELIRKHKLFKIGIRTFVNRFDIIKRVKQIIAEHLLDENEANEAYQMYRSIGSHQKALKIAKQLVNSNKILETVDAMFKGAEKQDVVLDILKGIEDEGKYKNQIGELYAFIGRYQEAMIWFLKAGNYQRAYNFWHKVDYAFGKKEFETSLSLIFSLHKNLLIKDKSECVQKYARLLKVHKAKKLQGESLVHRQRENEDMYSEVSVSSKTHSSYTVSITTGMKKKKEKKKNILSRNVKEGSSLEEEWLIAFINDVKSRVDHNIKQSKVLIQHLIYVDMVEEAEALRNVTRQYIDGIFSCKPKQFTQWKFEEIHPEAAEIYATQLPDKPKVDAFNYLL